MKSEGPQRFDLADRSRGQLVHPGGGATHHPLDAGPGLFQPSVSAGLLKLLQQSRDLGIDVPLGGLHDVGPGIGHLGQPSVWLGLECGTHIVPSFLQRRAGARSTEPGHCVAGCPPRLVHGQFDPPGSLAPLRGQGAHRRLVTLGPVRADDELYRITPFAGRVQIGHRVGNRRWKRHDPSKNCVVAPVKVAD